MIFTPFEVPVFVSATVYAVLGIYALRQRGVMAAAPFGIAILMASAWAWSYALDLSLLGLGGKLLVTKPRVIFVAILVVCWLMMALQYSGRGHWLTRRRLGALFVIPAITSVLTLTTEQHQLFRYDFYLTEMGTVVLLMSKFGPWWWVHVGFSYTMILFASVVLAISLRHAPSLYRRQTWLIIFAGLLPLLANVVYMAPFNPFPGFDTSTTVFLLTGPMVAWSLFRHRFLDLVPVAREKVFEAMQDIVIVVDPRGRIVDLNPAARELLGGHYLTAVGRRAEAVFRAWPEMVTLCTGAAPGPAIVYLRQGDLRRCYEVQDLPLTNRKGRQVGRVITLRDATERVQSQARELEQERAKALLESKDRLAQDIAEMLHGPVQTKLLVVWQLLSDCQGLLNTDPKGAEEVLAEAQMMLDAIREQDVRQASHRLHPAMISVSLMAGLGSLVDDFHGRLKLDLNVDPEVRRLDDPSHNLIPEAVRLAGYHIIDEALGNVYRHAGATRAGVSLSIDAQGRLAITVEDDGCGFEPAASNRGLGLTVIAGRAEQVGGTWHVSSANGRGATVTAALPLRNHEPSS